MSYPAHPDEFIPSHLVSSRKMGQFLLDEPQHQSYHRLRYSQTDVPRKRQYQVGRGPIINRASASPPDHATFQLRFIPTCLVRPLIVQLIQHQRREATIDRTEFLLYQERITMTMKISDDCISCGACEPACPTNSIGEGDPIYVINAETCVECVGHFDSPQCVAVCPVECIIQA